MPFWPKKKKEDKVNIEEMAVAQAMPGSSKKRKPQDRSKLTRNRQVQIRLTDEEAFALRTAAKENQMTLADFILAGVNQSRRIVIPGAAPLRVEVIRVGRNLNQALAVARYAQQNGYTIDVAYLQNTVKKVESVIERLNNLITMWNVDLNYKTKGEEKIYADCEV